MKIHNLYIVTIKFLSPYSIAGIPKSKEKLTRYELFTDRQEAAEWISHQKRTTQSDYRLQTLNPKKIISLTYFSGNRLLQVKLSCPGNLMNDFKNQTVDHQIRTFDGSSLKTKTDFSPDDVIQFPVLNRLHEQADSGTRLRELG